MYEEWMGVVITGLLVVPACVALRSRPKGADNSGRTMPQGGLVKRFQERRMQGRRGVYDGVERRVNHYFVETLGPLDTPFENGIDPRTGKLRPELVRDPMRVDHLPPVHLEASEQHGTGVGDRIGPA